MFNPPSNYLSEHESERLLIRPVTMADATEWLHFVSDPLAMQHYPPKLAGGLEAANVWIEGQLDRYRNGTFGLHSLVDKATGAYVGQCGLLAHVVEEQPMLEIGYSLMRSAWGKGYATEAAQWFRNYGFENELAPSIVSLIHAANVPSQKVAERNGMHRGAPARWRGMTLFVYKIERTHWVQAYQ